MRTEVIYSSSDHPSYGAGSGDTERIEYMCPCGKGKAVEEHGPACKKRTWDLQLFLWDRDLLLCHLRQRNS